MIVFRKDSETVRWILLFTFMGLLGCAEKDMEKENEVVREEQADQPTEEPMEEVKDYYPAEDVNAVLLTGSAAAKFERVLREVNPEDFMENDVFEMPEEKRKKMKAVLDVVVRESPKEAIGAITDWINKTVEYGYESLDPYEIVVDGKSTTCQGYENAMRMACTLYGYPVIGVCGRLYNEDGPGHAYVYTHAEGRWWVYDALNDIRCDAGEVEQYEHLLVPEISDVALFEDEGFLYDYDRGLNVCAVKKVEKSGNAEGVVTIPHAKKGICVTGCAFKEMLPPEVRELYIGSGIEQFGENAFGLKMYARSVEHIFIAERNEAFEVWEDVVYERNFNHSIPYFIPTQLEIVRLKPMHTAGKGVIADHVHYENQIREIYFTDTRRIEDYAVERCPELECIYIQEGTVVAAKAFPEGVRVEVK